MKYQKKKKNNSDKFSLKLGRESDICLSIVF